MRPGKNHYKRILRNNSLKISIHIFINHMWQESKLNRNENFLLFRDRSDEKHYLLKPSNHVIAVHHFKLL